MSVSLEQLQTWMDSIEGEHLEFKAAKDSPDFDLLTKYCVAIANEGGGHIVLGVTDRRPRRVVGSRAFGNPERTRRGLADRLPLRIEIDEVSHPDDRVLVFHVPSRPIGVAIEFKGAYWARRGDSLVAMTADRLRAIFAEAGHDFSADACPSAALDDLDSVAIEEFRGRWISKSGSQALSTLSQEQLLSDAEAIVDGTPTFAALVLFGTRKALGKHLAQAEVTFEYRSSDASGPAQDRKEYRRGFFAYYDELWKTINLRNDRQHYQDGLFVFDIPTFSERPVREAILNAVSHRDYQLGGNVFVHQYPRRLEITSPGGLPTGISLQNIRSLISPAPINTKLPSLSMATSKTLNSFGFLKRSGGKRWRVSVPAIGLSLICSVTKRPFPKI
jgi:ATP-dependent DNA helicase RecG